MDPTWGQNPTSLEIVNLKVGIKGKEGTEGWKRRKVNSQGSRLPGKSSDVAPKTTTTLSPGLCSYGLLVFFTTVPGTQPVRVLELVVWVQILALPLISCVTLDKLLHLSGPQYPHLQHEANNSIYLIGL